MVDKATSIHKTRTNDDVQLLCIQHGSLVLQMVLGNSLKTIMFLVYIFSSPGKFFIFIYFLLQKEKKRKFHHALLKIRVAVILRDDARRLLLAPGCVTQNINHAFATQDVKPSSSSSLVELRGERKKKGKEQESPCIQSFPDGDRIALYEMRD